MSRTCSKCARSPDWPCPECEDIGREEDERHEIAVEKEIADLRAKLAKAEQERDAALAEVERLKVDLGISVQLGTSYRDKLRGIETAIWGLIDQSCGIAGLHLNGDIAPWDDLLEGGKFEEWLRALGKRNEGPSKGGG